MGMLFVCLSPPVPPWLLTRAGAGECSPPLVWLRGVFGLLPAGDEGARRGLGCLPRRGQGRIWGAGNSLPALKGAMCRAGVAVGCWKRRRRLRGACPAVKVFSTVSGQGDACFKVKPVNYVMSQMGL